MVPCFAAVRSLRRAHSQNEESLEAVDKLAHSSPTQWREKLKPFLGDDRTAARRGVRESLGPVSVDTVLATETDGTIADTFTRTKAEYTTWRQRWSKKLTDVQCEAAFDATHAAQGVHHDAPGGEEQVMVQDKLRHRVGKGTTWEKGVKRERAIDDNEFESDRRVIKKRKLQPPMPSPPRSVGSSTVVTPNFTTVPIDDGTPDDVKGNETASRTRLSRKAQQVEPDFDLKQQMKPRAFMRYCVALQNEVLLTTKPVQGFRMRICIEMDFPKAEIVCGQWRVVTHTGIHDRKTRYCLRSCCWACSPIEYAYGVWGRLYAYATSLLRFAFPCGGVRKQYWYNDDETSGQQRGCSETQVGYRRTADVGYRVQDVHVERARGNCSDAGQGGRGVGQ